MCYPYRDRLSCRILTNPNFLDKRGKRGVNKKQQKRVLLRIIKAHTWHLQSRPWHTITWKMLWNSRKIPENSWEKKIEKIWEIPGKFWILGKSPCRSHCNTVLYWRLGPELAREICKTRREKREKKRLDSSTKGDERTVPINCEGGGHFMVG